MVVVMVVGDSQLDPHLAWLSISRQECTTRIRTANLDDDDVGRIAYNSNEDGWNHSCSPKVGNFLITGHAKDAHQSSDN